MEENVVEKGKIGYFAALVVYALGFLAVVITPFLIKPLAKAFDFVEMAWSEKGLLREFFEGFFTALFWLLEMWVFRVIIKKIRKTSNSAATEKAVQEENTEKSVCDDAAETEVAMANVTSQEENRKLRKTELLPIKNVLILGAIVLACLTLVTIKIGFNVKLSYDLGEKVTRECLVNMGGQLLATVVKCIWITILLKTSLQYAESIFIPTDLSEKRKKIFSWLMAGGMIFLFGIYDAVMTAGAYVWVYLIFYVAFTAIYYFAKKDAAKSFWLILFIYIF